MQWLKFPGEYILDRWYVELRNMFNIDDVWYHHRNFWWEIDHVYPNITLLPPTHCLIRFQINLQPYGNERNAHHFWYSWVKAHQNIKFSPDWIMRFWDLRCDIFIMICFIVIWPFRLYIQDHFVDNLIDLYNMDIFLTKLRNKQYVSRKL